MQIPRDLDGERSRAWPRSIGQAACYVPSGVVLFIPIPFILSVPVPVFFICTHPVHLWLIGCFRAIRRSNGNPLNGVAVPDPVFRAVPHARRRRSEKRKGAAISNKALEGSGITTMWPALLMLKTPAPDWLSWK